MTPRLEAGYHCFVKTNQVTNACGTAKPESFRRILQAELANRCSQNPQYSLRAFARDLATDHASLSQLLRGRRKLTAKTIRKFGELLGLELAEIEKLVDAEAVVSESANAAVQAEIEQLSKDASNLICEWQHFAILELLRFESFEPNSNWIAQVLGLSVDEVNIALTRLIRLNLISMESPSVWRDLSGGSVLNVADFSQATIKNLEEQVQRLSKRAMQESSDLPQDHTVTTVGISKRRLPDLLAMVAKFRQSMLERLATNDPCDAVYQLEIRFFPITTNSSKG